MLSLDRTVLLVIILAMLGLTLRAAAEEGAATNASGLKNFEITPEGGINFYTDYHGKRLRSFAITPAGSLIAGGVSSINTPPTNDPPTIDPAEYDREDKDERSWIHDFYFGRYEQGAGQPRLHTRCLIMWGRGDSPDVQMGRTGPDNPPTTYGPPQDTEPGVCLGKMIFTAWGEGQFQGDIAGVYARNDTVPTSTRNPGSLHLGTAGESIGDEVSQKRAWRDMIDRLVISSRGYVAIGDGFTNAAERLHVDGNIRANGNLVAGGDVVVGGELKTAIANPAIGDRSVAFAAIVGPDAAIYFRGESQLVNGRAIVSLPDVFELVAARDGRTVLLTNLDGFDPLAIERQRGMQVADGVFVVVARDSSSTQAFSWEVKAVRADCGSRSQE